MIQLGMITFDTDDARGLASWWAKRLDGTLIDEAEGWFCMVTAQGLPVTLGFQKIENPTPGKNRLHLDFSRSEDVSREQLIAEWTAAGATHLGTRGMPDGSEFTWDTFSDPAGNEFCISQPHES